MEGKETVVVPIELIKEVLARTVWLRPMQLLAKLVKDQTGRDLSKEINDARSNDKER